MQKRNVGQTGILVSAIGLGTVKFGRNQGVKYPHAFELPTDQAIASLLATAAECGINLLDTAPAYGSSEERLGKVLRGQRHDWVISTKVGEEFENNVSHFDFSPAVVHKSIERSLRRLNTDYVDIVLVHSDGNDNAIIEQENIFTTLETLKMSGKIRAYGMSTKTLDGGLKAVTLSDLAMVTFDPGNTAERPVIARAHQLQKGIFIKKAFASGHQVGMAVIEETFNFICSEPGVTSVIVGTLNPQHLRENAASMVSCLQRTTPVNPS